MGTLSHAPLRQIFTLSIDPAMTLLVLGGEEEGRCASSLNPYFAVRNAHCD